MEIKTKAEKLEIDGINIFKQIGGKGSQFIKNI